MFRGPQLLLLDDNTKDKSIGFSVCVCVCVQIYMGLQRWSEKCDAINLQGANSADLVNSINQQYLRRLKQTHANGQQVVEKAVTLWIRVGDNNMNLCVA